MQIYEKAVRWALDYNEVYDAKNTKTPGANVKKVLTAASSARRQLKDGKTPWTTQTGPVRPRLPLEDRRQRAALLARRPEGLRLRRRRRKHRLDFWWHGRGETLSEANFMANAAERRGHHPRPGAFILHPYGRYCNANKFAGEIDTFECLDHAKKHYRIDENRLVARGF